MKIHKRQEGLVQMMSLPTGNHVGIVMTLKHGKKQMSLRFDRPPTLAERRVAEAALPKMEEKSAYIQGRLYARAQAHNRQIGSRTHG